MSVEIKYKGNTIASANTDTTKTLQTSGKYCEADIVVENVQDGGITPSGSVTLTSENTYDVTDKATAVVDFSTTRADLAEAVTAKGVDTLPTSSFDTIATNIGLISGGGGLPNVRKFTVTTDPTLGTYGGISFPVVSSGRANYFIMNTDPTHLNSTDRYARAIMLVIDYTTTTKNRSVYMRYDNAIANELTTALDNGVVTIPGSSVVHMEQTYTLDVYEVIW